MKVIGGPIKENLIVESDDGTQHGTYAVGQVAVAEELAESLAKSDRTKKRVVLVQRFLVSEFDPSVRVDKRYFRT